MEEKPSKRYLVNTGAYIINKKIIKLIPKDKMFNFNDLINKIKQQKNLRIGVYPINEKIGSILVHGKNMKKISEKKNK